jgi:hypothetical protein
MKKIILLFILISLLILITVNGLEIKVGINEVLEGKVTTVKYDSIIDGVFKTRLEFFNPGSVSYNARIRLDIFNKTDLLYTTWSQEEPIYPSGMKNFYVYWYPLNLTGNFTGRIRVYYANEIMELDPIELYVMRTPTPDSSIEILDFKTYEDEVEVSFKINKTIDNIIIVPSKYPKGWIFEQKKIEKINENKIQKATLSYKPSLWESKEITIDIFTEDGKYYTTKSFLMEKEKLNINILSYFIKIFKIFSISPFF